MTELTLQQRLQGLRLMIFDVDGVLTDGSLYYGEHGETLKVFHVLDGHGMKALMQAGILTAIISARSCAIVERRAQELGCRHVFQGAHDKAAAFAALLQTTQLTPAVCGFMGDDLLDLPVMRQVGFAATVPNAAEGVSAHAHWVSTRLGGQGAARQVCDLILAAQGR